MADPMAQPPPQEARQTKYTVFIRVPFPRGDFVDPPASNWDAEKDGDLWKTISSASRGMEIDWDGLADKYDVTLRFLLQQAAWLYERQLSQVREQLRKVNRPSAASPTPGSLSGSTTAGGYAMKRGGSGGSRGAGSRIPSVLSVRPRGSLNFDGSTPSTPIQVNARVPYSRTTSTNTITQIRRSSPKEPSTLISSPNRLRHSGDDENSRSRTTNEPKSSSRSALPVPRSLSSSSSSSSSGPIAYSRAFLPRRQRFVVGKAKGKAPLQSLFSGDDASDEDASFLPFSNQGIGSGSLPSQSQPTSPSATLRHAYAQGHSLPQSPPHRPSLPTYPSVTTSATSSNPATSASIPSLASPRSNPFGALSPRQQQALGGRAGGGGLGSNGSDGSPSMGSSFSDLDDTSVTQSALEEALAREMRAGRGSLGVVGRVGGLWRGQGKGQG